jgi:hypothetical protein
MDEAMPLLEYGMELLERYTLDSRDAQLTEVIALVNAIRDGTAR